MFVDRCSLELSDNDHKGTNKVPSAEWSASQIYRVNFFLAVGSSKRS
jgi:hypothetical protein